MGHSTGKVLVQLQDGGGEQVRIALTIEYAKHMIELLEINITKAEQSVRESAQREKLNERFRNRPAPTLTNNMFGAPHCIED